MPSLHCSDCTALITGANSGVGRAVAAALVAQGWTVILGCRSASKCADAAIAMNLGSTAGRAVAAPGLDLSSLAAVHAWVSNAGDLVQRLDLLVNNAGLAPAGNRTVLGVAGLEEGFAVMHLSHFALTKWLKEANRFTANARVVQVTCAPKSVRTHGGARL
jgi:retinol dehydrogenase-13